MPVKLPDGSEFKLRDGAVVIAAITSCTNTSNPAVMVGAGLLAKKAVERGLTRKPWVKTSLAPGSKVVTEYLDKAGLTEYLEQLQFNLVGYGCTTCIGNSGPLQPEISEAITSGDLSVCAVLSGNRNFEGRIHAEVKMNYLASPPLVVAYALAGSMDMDLFEEPLGEGSDGEPVYLRDIWPSQQEIHDTIEQSVLSEMFTSSYGEVFEGDEEWNGLDVPEGDRYAWDPTPPTSSTRPTSRTCRREPPESFDQYRGARILAVLGDSVTTDHISPAGAIKKDSPAGEYLHGARRRAEGLQLLRLPARQPRGDDARHVRQRAAAQPARPRHRGRLHAAPAGRRGDDDLRRRHELRGRGRAAGRARRQGVRLRLVARLGRQGPAPARRSGS